MSQKYRRDHDEAFRSSVFCGRDKRCVLPLSLLWYKFTWCVYESVFVWNVTSPLLTRLHSMYNWLNKSRRLWVLLCKSFTVQKLHSGPTNCFHLHARHVQEEILGVTFSPCNEQTCKMTLMMRFSHRAECKMNNMPKSSYSLTCCDRRLNILCHHFLHCRPSCNKLRFYCCLRISIAPVWFSPHISKRQDNTEKWAKASFSQR